MSMYMQRQATPTADAATFLDDDRELDAKELAFLAGAPEGDFAMKSLADAATFLDDDGELDAEELAFLAGVPEGDGTNRADRSMMSMIKVRSEKKIHTLSHPCTLSLSLRLRFHQKYLDIMDTMDTCHAGRHFSHPVELGRASDIMDIMDTCIPLEVPTSSLPNSRYFIGTSTSRDCGSAASEFRHSAD
jgi:hypothetical protein